MKNFIYIAAILFLHTTAVVAQVGINNPNPQETLDVNGSAIVSDRLYLENPGNSTQIRGSKLLIQKTDDQIVQYDIEQSKYGPINYVEFVFRNTNTAGLTDYDTKISATDYLVTIQGFYFLRAGSTDTNITIRSTLDNNKVEGFQVYAYISTATNTWHIKGFVNNSRFQNSSGADTSIDLYMNLIIFRNGFISKPLPNITVNMTNAETKTAPLPAGF
ncbi:hypothetical protein [Aequorivita echinoideorum]|uniref:Uncharacterized protein n=1 Tax=Aequorivita echinoideorum TaxID=1549647 RepID=A0ABS5S441_9FLAO|nr:hypothetical protein [Aequorivita echinoideorum]MBT0607963.1 hypothetical protein [Aequorivita echinoideorum]